MEIGIVGLPNSGKTTVFNALTGGHGQAAPRRSAGLEPNVGVVKVPDRRLEALTGLFSPRRTVPAEVKYIDVAGSPKGFGKGEGLGGQFLNHLGSVDAIIHVVRAFQDDTVPHVEGSVDPDRDIATMNLEMAFSDMAILERRLERLQDGLKAARAQEREAVMAEEAWLREIKSALEGDVPLRQQDLTEEQAKQLLSYPILTIKPLILLLNIGEEDLVALPDLESQYQSRYGEQGCEVVGLCGELEAEMAHMEEAEAHEFRGSWGMPSEPGLHRLIRTSYRLLGLSSFFTTGSDEVKAWSVPVRTTAPQAAGKIHSDMTRGFIRAEVVGFNELMESGGMAEARKRGLVRLEGRNYEVRDGDVINFLFNV